MRKIVVGVDGSASSHAALHWAAHESALREARLVVVHAWTLPPSAYGHVPAVVVEPDIYQANAAATLQRALASLPGSAGDVQIEERLVRGGAASALLDAAQDAELIVMGASAKGRIGQLLLGSTSRDVAREASVAVVIVPAHEAALAA